MDSLPVLPTLTERELEATWGEYEQALASLPGGPAERVKMLHDLLAGVSAQLEAQNRDLISRTLLDYASAADRPVLRSTTRGTPSSPDRGASASSPQPSASDLLSGSGRIGPRLAQKLVLASARASRRR